MRRIHAMAATVVVLALALPGSAAANNDPHRAFLAQTPFDLPAAYCGFPIHVDIEANREYGRLTDLADGSLMLVIRGSAKVVVSGPTGRTIEVNAGGPGTLVVAPDGLSSKGDLTGRGLLFATNLTDYGFPSNVVAAAGPNHGVQDFVTGEFTSFSGHPQVIADVCAAVAP